MHTEGVEFTVRQQNYLNYLTFTEYFVITWLRLLFAGPLVGPLFCGAPVRPNMLNMPKSTSVLQLFSQMNKIRD